MKNFFTFQTKKNAILLGSEKLLRGGFEALFSRRKINDEGERGRNQF